MEQDPAPHFDLRRTDGVAVLTVHGDEIFPEARAPLLEAADGLAGAPEPRQLVLNLENLRRIDSVTIAVLVTFQKRVREAGWSLKVCAADPHVLGVFRVTRLDGMMELHESLRHAVDAYLGRGGSWASRIFGPG
jgi:anti-anti-sigma factor